jgi:hypothetical protein
VSSTKEELIMYFFSIMAINTSPNSFFVFKRKNTCLPCGDIKNKASVLHQMRGKEK